MLLARLDGGEVRREALAQRRQVVRRDVELARSRPQREKPLLGLLEVARVERGGALRRLQRRARLVERGKDAVQRLDHGPHELGRLRAAPFQTPQERRDRRPGAAWPATAS